ncbi:MAG: ATP-dependent Lon protease [Flavobacteriaceae bacterium]
MKKNIHTKKILITAEQKSIIVNEFNTTRQTVYCALKYYNNSELAKKIRMRAKELLIEEIQKIENDV